MSTAEQPVARSVLFVDFDNIGLSLKNTDPALANAFARAPQVWVDALERGELIDDDGLLAPRRRFLMKRCYANPRLIDPYRANFTWAGFQVVDCPPLTGGGKNSADIYMVMDILDALEHKTAFDEFFILSSDADFTPVLTRLTAHDRRTVIYANQVTAQSYKTMCDGLIPEPAFISLVAKTLEAAQRERSRRTASAPTHHPVQPMGEPRPPAPPVVVEPSEVAATNRPRLPQIPNRVRNMARAIAEQTGVPYLAPAAYAALFNAIAEHAQELSRPEDGEKAFSFNQTVKAVSARIEAATGWSLFPKDIAFVLKGVHQGGIDLSAGPVDVLDIAKAFSKQVSRLANRAGLGLQTSDRKEVWWWMRSGLPSRPVMVGDGSATPDPLRPTEDAEPLVDGGETEDAAAAPIGSGETVAPETAHGQAPFDTGDEPVAEHPGADAMAHDLVSLDADDGGDDDGDGPVDDLGDDSHESDADDRDEDGAGDGDEDETGDDEPDEDEAGEDEASDDADDEGDEKADAEDGDEEGEGSIDDGSANREPVDALDAADNEDQGGALTAGAPTVTSPPRRGWWQVSPSAPISPLARAPQDTPSLTRLTDDTPLAHPTDPSATGETSSGAPAGGQPLSEGDELDRILEQLRTIGLSPPSKGEG